MSLVRFPVGPFVVPLEGGYPFFAQNAFVEPRSVHTCLLGLVGVPRAKREAVAPYCAAWGRKPEVARGQVFPND